MDSSQLEKLKPQLFALVRTSIKTTRMPYATLLVDKRTGVVIARSYNDSVASYDPSDQTDVVAIRKAKEALEAKDLADMYLFSFFEPTVLSFDIAMFAKITSFAWCISATDAPEHYLITDYSVRVYDRDHPGKIQIMADYAKQEALGLLNDPDIHIPRGYLLGGQGGDA